LPQEFIVEEIFKSLLISGLYWNVPISLNMKDWKEIFRRELSSVVNIGLQVIVSEDALEVEVTLNVCYTYEEPNWWCIWPCCILM